eukprot:GEMP01004319.1.p1 GENE.GEMP01004319.1~~GEMP01004319.1.p1  ORF type:complete len:1115 (+),score=261.26 GEMP01004319.1:234-3578(+)
MQHAHDRKSSRDPSVAYARLVRPMLRAPRPSRDIVSPRGGPSMSPTNQLRPCSPADQQSGFLPLDRRKIFRHVPVRCGMDKRRVSADTTTCRSWSGEVDASLYSTFAGLDDVPVSEAETDGVALNTAHYSCTVHCDWNDTMIEAAGCRTVLDVKVQVAMQLEMFVVQVELWAEERAGAQLRDDESPPLSVRAKVTEFSRRALSIGDWKHILRAHAQVGDLRGVRAAWNCMCVGVSSSSSTLRNRRRIIGSTSDMEYTAEETPHGVVLAEVLFDELNVGASDPFRVQQQLCAIRSLCSVDISLASMARDADGYSLLHRVTKQRVIQHSVVDVLLACGADVEGLTPGGWFTLAFAAKSGDADVCLQLLVARGDVNHRHAVDLWTPLMLAAHRGHVSVVQTLLAHGATCNMRDYEEWTALHFAAQKGHADVTMALLKAEARVDVVTNTASTPLQMAARKGHTDVCALLVAHGASLGLVNSQGQTALNYAVWEGHLTCVSLLVDARAKVNIRSVSGFSPLGLAAWRGCPTISSCLIAARAQVDQQNGDGVTPLLLAVEHHHVEVAARLLVAQADIHAESYHNRRSPWSVACEVNDTDMISLLASHFGERLNEISDDGQTTLLVAIHAEQPAVVEALLACKVDANVSSSDGWCPLAVAAEYGFMSIVDLLLQSGQCDINQRSPQGWTALLPAAQNGHECVVSLLLTRGAKVDVCDSAGWLPLTFAARNGHVSVVHALVRNRASVDARSGPHTALTLAAQRGHADVVALLLSNGASANMRNNSAGQTSLHLAAWEGHTAVVEQLLGMMADMDVETDSGATPLDMASHRHNASVIRALVDHKASVIVGRNGSTSRKNTEDVACQPEHGSIAAKLKPVRREKEELAVEIDSTNTISTLIDVESPVAIGVRTSPRGNISRTTAHNRLDRGGEWNWNNARQERLEVPSKQKDTASSESSKSVPRKGVSRLRRVGTDNSATHRSVQEEGLGTQEDVAAGTHLGVLRRTLTAICSVFDGCHGFGRTPKHRRLSRRTRRASTRRSRPVLRSPASSTSLGGKAIRYKPRQNARDYWNRKPDRRKVENAMASPSTSSKLSTAEEPEDLSPLNGKKYWSRVRARSKTRQR